MSQAPFVPGVTEPAEGNDLPSYAYDGEETMLSSKKHKKLSDDGSTDNVFSTCDRVTNGIAVFLLFAILITSIISIAAGSCCLATLAGKEFHRFPMFYAFGVAPVVIGCLCFALVVGVLLFISLCAMGIRNYGMCCALEGKASRCLSVCLLGVFPLFVFLVCLAMCIVGFTFYSLGKQVPPLSKNYIDVEGIAGPVEIVRDANGLTHIKANSRRDAYFGQGFAQAQDRLFQIEFHRLVGRGQLSTCVAKSGLKTDLSTRTVNVRDAAKALCRNAQPQDLDMFQAFADGVNLYLKRVSKRPVEFFFMSAKPLYFHDPKPFTVEDICVASRLVQFQMSANFAQEGARFSVWARTDRKFSEVEELFPDYLGQNNTIMTEAQMKALGKVSNFMVGVNRGSAQFSAIVEAGMYDTLLAAARSMLFGGSSGASAQAALRLTSLQEQVQNSVGDVMQNFFHRKDEIDVFANKFIHASNAWAARDEHNNAMAASDPHLSIMLPSTWYYTHLSFPAGDGTQYDAAGMGFVGIPGVHIGKTTYVAWGITMSMTDLEDLFILPPGEMFGLPSDKYMYGGKQLNFVNRRERIHVKGSKDVVLDVEDTVFGPVVSSLLGIPAALRVALYAVPLRHDDNSSIAALLGLSDPMVNTAEKLIDNFLLLQSPGFSIPLADVKGNIGYVVTGRHPVRDSGHTGKYPTLALDKRGLLFFICGVVQELIWEDMCDLGLFFTQLGGASVESLLPLVRKFLLTREWTTYVGRGPHEEDTYVNMTRFNPRLYFPADGKAAHISAANQKILPDGYPYVFGNDYAQNYRGRRLQERLGENVNLSSLDVHMDIQMDKRSNIWHYDFRSIVQNSTFQALIAGNAGATAWSTRLLNWDSNAVLGSVEAAFFWRWLQRMAVLPRDAAATLEGGLWPITNGYITRMLTAPSQRMLNECAEIMQKPTPGTPAACMEFAAAEFTKQASNPKFGERWGYDLNRLHGAHEMLETTFLKDLYRREMPKAGDISSLDVSGSFSEGGMASKQASSMRQLYDLWNQTDYMYVGFPGGNSGNPYSKMYQNLWEKFKRDEYVHVATNAKSWKSMQRSESQVLSP